MMTEEQKRKVEENINLVWRVIHDKLSGDRNFGIFTKEDLFQIGCIGLCKAIQSDKGGNFSAYAYRIIWQRISDALIYASRRQVNEFSCDIFPTLSAEAREDVALKIDLERILTRAKGTAPNATAKGIVAMELMALGYSSKEIGQEMDASDKLVCAWISKARKYLKEQNEVQELRRA